MRCPMERAPRNLGLRGVPRRRALGPGRQPCYVIIIGRSNQGVMCDFLVPLRANLAKQEPGTQVPGPLARQAFQPSLYSSTGSARWNGDYCPRISASDNPESIYGASSERET